MIIFAKGLKMSSTKAGKVVKQPKVPNEIEELKKQIKDVEFENLGLRLGLAKVAEEYQDLQLNWIQDVKSFCLKLGGDVYIEGAIRASGLDPLLRVQQDYDQYGGCRYILTKERLENEK